MKLEKRYIWRHVTHHHLNTCCLATFWLRFIVCLLYQREINKNKCYQQMPTFWFLIVRKWHLWKIILLFILKNSSQICLKLLFSTSFTFGMQKTINSVREWDLRVFLLILRVQRSIKRIFLRVRVVHWEFKMEDRGTAISQSSALENFILIVFTSS